MYSTIETVKTQVSDFGNLKIGLPCGSLVEVQNKRNLQIDVGLFVLHIKHILIAILITILNC